MRPSCKLRYCRLILIHIGRCTSIGRDRKGPGIILKVGLITKLGIFCHLGPGDAIRRENRCSKLVRSAIMRRARMSRKVDKRMRVSLKSSIE